VLLNRRSGIRADLADLYAADEDLARRFEELRDALDRLDHPPLPLPAPPPAAEATGRDRERRRDLEAELDVVVRRIRALPGQAGFQRPPSVPSLLAEAAHGPVVVVNVSEYRCDALLLGADGLRQVPLEGLDADELERAADVFHADVVTALDPRAAQDEVDAANERVTATLDLLWREVAGPVLAELRVTDPDTRVWWVPTGALCRLNVIRHRTGRGTGMSSSTMSITSPAPKTRRRRPAGEVILGVDTHRDAHMAAALSVMGTVLDTDEFPATAVGYRDLLQWARKLGVVGRAGVEGTGSYGASLSRYLLAQGVDVFDVNRMDWADRRRRGKSDPLDAQNAARAVLSGRARARAKSGDGPVQIARMYKLTKASAVKARTQAINQLKAVLITADPALREELAGLAMPNSSVPVHGSLTGAVRKRSARKGCCRPLESR